MKMGLVKKIKKYWRILGPGLTTGAADDDPSGIITYSQAGAMFGYQLLWLALFTFPLVSVVQEMCARISLVTGKGLASNIRGHFSKYILYMCIVPLLIANTFNIGADLQAMTEVLHLIFPQIPSAVTIIAITALSLGLQIFVTYVKFAKYLKWLALVLFFYVLSALLSGLNWREVASSTFIPTITFSKEQMLIICAIFGTTISPYLFFWETAQEIEEEIVEGKKTVQQRKGATTKDIKKMRIDVWSGMLFSNIVMFFIIAACASVLFTHGIKNIETPAQAAAALKPVAGNASYVLFVLGIVGTGLLAVPVLAGASAYALAEGFGWHNIGLYRKLKSAHSFYAVIAVSMLSGLAMNFFAFDPIKALIWSAVLNGITAPIFLILILLLSNNNKIMGKSTNNIFTKIIGWITVVVMSISGIAAIFSVV
ncbi:MAG: divalent metal cation transporter [Gammaproteobacteria bacterium]|nr:divalent metal cation transporter [Gammaproteobacteria bacterium]